MACRCWNSLILTLQCSVSMKKLFLQASSTFSGREKDASTCTAARFQNIVVLLCCDGRLSMVQRRAHLQFLKLTSRWIPALFLENINILSQKQQPFRNLSHLNTRFFQNFWLKLLNLSIMEPFKNGPNKELPAIGINAKKRIGILCGK